MFTSMVKPQQYCPEGMQLAIRLVLVRDGMAKKAAALLDKLAGRVPLEHVKPGRKTLLTADEETSLEDYTIY
jgi:hypothetical protein